MGLRTGEQVRRGFRPGVRAGQILRTDFDRAGVIRVAHRKSYAAFCRDAFRLQIAAELILRVAVHRNVLERPFEIGIVSSAEIQAYRSRRRPGSPIVEIDRHADWRIPAPSQAAIRERLRKPSVPDQRTDNWRIEWNSARVNRFEPDLFCIRSAPGG